MEAAVPPTDADIALAMMGVWALVSIYSALLDEPLIAMYSGPVLLVSIIFVMRATSDMSQPGRQSV